MQISGQLMMPTAESLFALVAAGCIEKVKNVFQNTETGQISRSTKEFLQTLEESFAAKRNSRDENPVREPPIKKRQVIAQKSSYQEQCCREMEVLRHKQRHAVTSSEMQDNEESEIDICT